MKSFILPIAISEETLKTQNEDLDDVIDEFIRQIRVTVEDNISVDGIAFVGVLIPKNKIKNGETISIFGKEVLIVDDKDKCCLREI